MSLLDLYDGHCSTQVFPEQWSNDLQRMSEHVITEVKDNVFYITLRREKKYNSLNAEMYRALITAFEDAENDDEVMLTVITGTGLYYSAGSDFTPDELSDMVAPAPGSYLPYKVWVDNIIRHSKPVIALVNGHAMGVAVTTLALCDAVFATDKATFLCPFTSLGLSPEAASSSSFVAAMGYSKAARLALFAEKVTAEEAYIAGLVTKVFPHEQFAEETKKIIENYRKLGKQSLVVSKKLLRPQELVEKLLTVNRQEYEVLLSQLQQEETLDLIMNKFTKSKV